MAGCFDGIKENLVSNKRVETCDSLRNCQLLVRSCAAGGGIIRKHTKYKTYIQKFNASGIRNYLLISERLGLSHVLIKRAEMMWRSQIVSCWKLVHKSEQTERCACHTAARYTTTAPSQIGF